MKWFNALGITVIVTLADVTHAQQAERITVLLINHAEVPSDAMTTAQDHGSRIFLAGGVGVEWAAVGRADDSRSDLTVIVVAKPQRHLIDRRNVLGLALIGTTRAGRIVYAFYDRVEHHARATSTDPAVLLGHVIVHEMGHVLLGHRRHSLAGVMSRNWDRLETERIRQGLLTFTNDEAAAIRRSLEFARTNP